MPEYIEREALLNPKNIKCFREDTGIIEYPYDYIYAVDVDVIKQTPPADVAEVKHGHIIEHQGHEDEYYCECSVCESKEVYIGDKYCSECGAKLDGKG